MDRRALFFLGAALLCLALVPLTPETYRYVGIILTSWLTVLGLLSHLDYRSRTR
ncbi:MAG TPA: hypothetical protein VF855_11990 [Acidimicrobiales bacterium]